MARSIDEIIRFIEEQASTEPKILALEAALREEHIPEKLSLIIKADQWSAIDELAECYDYDIPSYTLVKFAGKGAFGDVYKGIGPDGARAIKILVTRENKGANVEEAYTIWGVSGLFDQERLADRFRHENIIRYYGRGELGEGTKYLILEWIDGETLEQKKRISTAEADEIFSQIFAGVAHMHREGFIHNDLRRANIFIEHHKDQIKPRVTLFDYTLATKHFYGVSSQQLSLSSRELLPPEIHRGGNFTIQTDIWALGNLMYQSLTGEHPFPYDTKDEIHTIVTNPDSYAALAKRINTKIPRRFRRCIQKCLSYDAQNRYRAVREMYEDIKPRSFFSLPIIVLATAAAGIVFMVTGRDEEIQQVAPALPQAEQKEARCSYRISSGEEKYAACAAVEAKKRAACITFKEAEALMDSCKYEDALSALEGLLIQDDTDIRYYGALLETYVGLKRLFEAGEVKEVIKTKFPGQKSREAYVLAPWIVKTGITSKRLRTLTERQCLIEFIREKYPECDALVAADALEGKQAIAAYEKVLEQNPNSYLAHLGLSRALFNDGEINAALRHYDAVEQIIEMTGATNAEIAEQFAAKGDYLHAFLFSYRNWKARFPQDPIDAETRHAALEIGKLSERMSSIMFSEGDRVYVGTTACQNRTERCYGITVGALYTRMLDSCGNKEDLFTIKNCTAWE